METATETQIGQSKRARNRRDYAKSKAQQEHVLLRLDPGGIASLDAAAKRAGLSRAAFARLFLPALLDATSRRQAEVEAARAALGLSLGQFLGRAIDEALERARAAPSTAPPAAAEFDALFG